VVVKGFMKKFGTDYEETYVLVARYDSFRLLIAITAYHQWIPQQIDVKSAFLYGLLKEEIYMRLPEGYRNAEKLLRSESVSTDSNNPPASGTYASLRYFGKLDLLYHTLAPVCSFTSLNQPSFQSMWMISQLSAQILFSSKRFKSNSSASLTARTSEMQIHTRTRTHIHQDRHQNIPAWLHR